MLRTKVTQSIYLGSSSNFIYATQCIYLGNNMLRIKAIQCIYLGNKQATIEITCIREYVVSSCKKSFAL